MSTELERQITTLKQGEHLCLIYENAAELMAAIIPFVQEGLTRNERCVYMADARSGEEVAQALAVGGIDVAEARERGALVLLTEQDAILRSRPADPRAVIDFLKRALEDALAAGFSGLRGAGEMTWLLGPQTGKEGLLGYEALLNDFFRNSRALGLCLYHRARFAPALLRDVLRMHPLAVLGDQVCPNLYYEPPVLDDSAEERHVDWMIAQLKRARAAQRLAAEASAQREQFRTTLNSLAANRRRRRWLRRQQREQFRTTLNSIADGVIVTNRSGRVIFLNATAQELTGWGEDARGRELSEVFRLVDPTTHAVIEDPVHLALHEGTVVARSNPALLHARNDTERPLEYRAAPVRDEKGRIGGVVLIFQDVTERRRHEEALRTSEALYRTLMDAIPQIVWTAGADGLRDYVSRQWYDYTGTAPEQSRSVGWEAFLHPEEAEAVHLAWTQAIETQQPFRMEFRLRRHDGRYRWFLSRALPVRTARREVIKWIGTSTDIDDVKRTEEALKETDRRKNEFLAMLAHELRNPLAPIRHSLELLRFKGPTDTELEYARDVIDRQVRQLTRLVDDLLDVARFTRGLVMLRKMPVDLATAVTSAVEISRPLIDARHQKLTVTLPAEPLSVEADLTRLSQILANLLNNAAKYTPEGGQIWLTTERDGDEATLRVRDTGIGIPPEMLAKVFDLFTQVDRTLDRSEGGLGIGLTLVRRLVEAHNGSVTCFSEGTGKGSEFVVRLPLLPEPAAPTTEAAPAPTLPTSPQRILIVDDHRDAAESLALLLRLHGREVHMVHDGLAALEEARTYQPDVVFLDIGLPGLNGLEVARRLREDLGLKKALLVAVTGYGQLEDHRRSKEAGFDAHLVKPVDLDALFALLAQGRSSAPDAAGP